MSKTSIHFNKDDEQSCSVKYMCSSYISTGVNHSLTLSCFTDRGIFTAQMILNIKKLNLKQSMTHLYIHPLPPTKYYYSMVT